LDGRARRCAVRSRYILRNLLFAQHDRLSRMRTNAGFFRATLTWPSIQDCLSACQLVGDEARSGGGNRGAYAVARRLVVGLPAGAFSPPMLTRTALLLRAAVSSAHDVFKHVSGARTNDYCHIVDSAFELRVEENATLLARLGLLCRAPVLCPLFDTRREDMSPKNNTWRVLQNEVPVPILTCLAMGKATFGEALTPTVSDAPVICRDDVGSTQLFDSPDTHHFGGVQGKRLALRRWLGGKVVSSVQQHSRAQRQAMCDTCFCRSVAPEEAIMMRGGRPPTDSRKAAGRLLPVLEGNY